MELVDIECELYRLIPSRFPPVSVFDGLVANDRLDHLAEIEARTNPRLQSDERLRVLYGDSGSPQLQNWNLAPFKYLNPEGSRFFPPTRPALELSDDQQTALAVAVARREGFLRRTSEAALGLDMRMLKTPVAGKFADLSEVSPNLEREKRWEIARDLPEAADGIIYCPPERPSHRCYAVLRGDRLGRTIQTVHYRFAWDGSRISAVYAFDEVGRRLRPEDFSLADDALAA
ncbi:MAG: RES family NAD+ phosphorylase [Halothiobacillus sp.]|nr:RES family NAD+ phosphorylase [Halothiobacillus sp.]